MTTRKRDNIIGREIYEHIKDFSNPQRIQYFKSISTEHKELYKNILIPLDKTNINKMKQINKKQTIKQKKECKH